MKKVRTLCKDCIFRVNDNNGDQTGCEIERLKVFKQLATPMEFNKDSKSFIIERLCNACRNEEWAEKVGGVNHAVKVRHDIKIKYDLIFVIEPERTKYEQICAATHRSIKSALEQTLPPNTIFIITNNPLVVDNIADFVKVVAPLLKDTGIKYQVIRHLEKKSKYLDLIDSAVSRCKYQYYTANPIGYEIPKDTFEKLDIAINDKLYQILMVDEASYKNYPTVIQNKIHELCNGNFEKSIIDKIKELAEKEQSTDVVRKWSEL